LLRAWGFRPVVIYPKGAIVPTKEGPKPATGKEPIGSAWGLGAISAQEIIEHFIAYPDAGVGLTFGPGRAPGGGWLVDIEGDGDEAEDSRAELLGGEVLETLGWSSVRGGHSMMIVHDEARMAAIQAALGRSGVIKDKKDESNLPGLEIRCGGCYKTGTAIQIQSVCPPTPGTDGVPRQWHDIETLQAVPEAFYAFLEALAAAKAAQQAPQPVVASQGHADHDPAWDGTLDIVDAERLEHARTWLHKKLTAFAQKVATEVKGNRRTALRDHTRVLAGILAHANNQKCHLLDEQDVIDRMTAAADECGLEPERRNDAMTWALETGKAEPCWPEELKLFEDWQDDDDEGHEPLGALDDDLDDEGDDDPAYDADDELDADADADPAYDADDDGAPGPHAHAHAAGSNGQAQPQGGKGKPEPDPEEGEVVDRFPILDPTALHGPAGDFVLAVDAQTEADPVGMLVQLLVGFASAIGRKPYFAVGGTRHYLNLFACLVGMTSIGRKGTALDVALWLLKRVDATWGKNCIRTGLVSGEGLIYHVRDEVKKGDKVLDDGVHDKRLLVIESEFARTLRAMGRQESTLSSVLRLAWDTGDLATMAKNSPNRATGAHVSLLCHVTQDDLSSFLSTTDLANGFGNRFAWPLVRRSKLLPDGGTLEGQPLGGIVHAFEEAWLFGRNHVTALERDAEAAALWAAVYPVLTQGSPGLLGLMLGRAEAMVMRMGCIYALLDRQPVVGVAHLRAALALWRYCEDSARLIFGDRCGDPDAEKLLAALRAAPAGLTRTQISVDVFRRNKPAKVLAELLSRLLTRGMVHSVPEPTESGRTIHRWRAGKGASSPSS
jgi:hypothetical protein